MHRCSEAAKAVEELEDVYVVHHWDCDGIASAAIVFTRRESHGLRTRFEIPPIETYDRSVYRRLGIDARNTLVVLDYAVYPESGVVFDHHRADPVGEALICNPVLSGADEMSYPSTTTVLQRYVGTGRLDLVALGIVGDLGSRALRTEWRRIVEEGAEIAGVSVEELVRCANILNTCYVMLDSEIVSYAREVLIRNGIKGVIADGKLSGVVSDIEDELKSIVSSVSPELEDSKVIMFRVRSRFSIVSKVGRALAERYPNKIVVVVGHVEGKNIDRIYVRSTSTNLSKVLQHLKRAGVGKSVGGKDWVFSVLCASSQCEDELPIVLKALREC
ncbi:MAG: DHH family phosphoesterase [Crenarchaeota archaeon]|nr:DHH family phosphoesterase [Thermoproteota archaeon]